MHEMILCKLGEVVLKGLNRRSFEDKLMSNVNRRVSKCGNFRVYSKQSTIYVEPKDDECDIEAAFESCKKVFGIIAVSKALPCEKDIQKIISAAKEYLACEMRTARSFKVESKRADKTFPLTSIQISQQVGGALHQAFPTCEVNVHDPELVVHIEIRDDAAYVHGPAKRARAAAHRHGRRGGQPALRRHRLARLVLHDRQARRQARNGALLLPTVHVR